MTAFSNLKHIMIVGSATVDALELCYARAFAALGSRVTTVDFHGMLARQTRLGTAGAFIHNFWPTDAWVGRANRELLISILDAKPDLVVANGYRLTAGTLAQVRCALPSCRLVLIWPDTLLNCNGYTLGALPVYDLIATYSQASVEPFRRLGGNARWVPLAFDPEFHSPAPVNSASHEFSNCDVSFVGNHNPEREQAIVTLWRAGFRVKVWGHRSTWRRAADQKALKSYFQGRPLFGAEFTRAIQSSRMSINPIARSNYPAANMRFFEITGVGGVALNSACPEMDTTFQHGRDCFYFDYGKNLVEIARGILDSPEQSEAVRKSARQKVLDSHRYVDRAQDILNLLNGGEYHR